MSEDRYQDEQGVPSLLEVAEYERSDASWWRRRCEEQEVRDDGYEKARGIHGAPKRRGRRG